MRAPAGSSTRSRSGLSPQPAKRVRRSRSPSTRQSTSIKENAVSRVPAFGAPLADGRRSTELEAVRKRRSKDASNIPSAKRRANSDHSVCLPAKSGPTKVGGAHKANVRSTPVVAMPSKNPPTKYQQRPGKIGKTQKQAASSKEKAPQPPLEDSVTKYRCCLEKCSFTAPTQELIAHIRQKHSCIKEALWCRRCCKTFKHLFEFLCHLNPKCEAAEMTATTVNRTHSSPIQPNSSHKETTAKTAGQQNAKSVSEKASTQACQSETKISDTVARKASTATSPVSKKKSRALKCHNTAACEPVCPTVGEKNEFTDKDKCKASTAASPLNKVKSRTPRHQKTAASGPIGTAAEVCEDAVSEVKDEVSDARKSSVNSQQLRVLPTYIHPPRRQSAVCLALVHKSSTIVTHQLMLFPQCVTAFMNSGQCTKVFVYSHPLLEVQRVTLSGMDNKSVAFFCRHPHAFYKKLSTLFDPLRYAELSLLLCCLCNKHRRLPGEVVRAFERYFHIVSAKRKARRLPTSDETSCAQASASVPDTYSNTTVFRRVPLISPPVCASAPCKTKHITISQNTILCGLDETALSSSHSYEEAPSMCASREVTAPASSAATSGACKSESSSLCVRRSAAENGACLDSVQVQSPLVLNGFATATSSHPTVGQLYVVPSLASQYLVLKSCSVGPTLVSDVWKACPLTSIVVAPSLAETDATSLGAVVPLLGYKAVRLPQLAPRSLYRRLAPRSVESPFKPRCPSGVPVPVIWKPSLAQETSVMPTIYATSGTSSQEPHHQPMLPSMTMPGLGSAQPLVEYKSTESSCRLQIQVSGEVPRTSDPAQLNAPATVSSSTLPQAACPVSAFPSNIECKQRCSQLPYATSQALGCNKRQKMQVPGEVLQNPTSMLQMPSAIISSNALLRVPCPVSVSNRKPSADVTQPHAASRVLENNHMQQRQVPLQVLISHVPTQQDLCAVVSCCTSRQLPGTVPAVFSNSVSNWGSAKSLATNEVQENDSNLQMQGLAVAGATQRPPTTHVSVSRLLQVADPAPDSENARMQTIPRQGRITCSKAQNQALIATSENLISTHQASLASVSTLYQAHRFVSGHTSSLVPKQRRMLPQFANKAAENTSMPRVSTRVEELHEPNPMQQMPPASVSSSTLPHASCPVSVLPTNLPLNPVSIQQQAAEKSHGIGALQRACLEGGGGLCWINMKSALGKLMLNNSTFSDPKEQHDHVCDCGFRASSQDSMEGHMANLHTVPFSRECKLCGKKFLTGKDLWSHFGEHIRQAPRSENESAIVMDDILNTESPSSPESSQDEPADYTTPNQRASPLGVQAPITESTKHDKESSVPPLVQPAVDSGIFDIRSMLALHSDSEQFEAAMIPYSTSSGEPKTPLVPDVCASLVDSRAVVSQVSLSKADEEPVTSAGDADSSASPQSPWLKPGEDTSFQKLRPDLAGTIAIKAFFKCIIKACTFTADSPSSYSTHLAYHTLKELELLCIYCGQRFEAIALLVHHMVQAHSRRWHQCGWCLYRCADPLYRQVHHSLEHVGKRPLFFKCDNAELGSPKQIFPCQQVCLNPKYWALFQGCITAHDSYKVRILLCLEGMSICLLTARS